jgi:molybdopterin-guanine dinucleotide biosynthesis protein A
MAIVGVVLAGGLSRRMGGGDKPLRLLAGRPILEHVIARIGPQVTALALNANGDPARFGGFGLPVIADGVPGNPGPLAGVFAAMRWAHQSPGATHVLTVPGDTPFVPIDLVSRLDAARRQSRAAIAVAESGGIVHPVVTLWPVDLAVPLRTALSEGTRRVWDFLDRYSVSRVPFATDDGDPFHNINTADDMAEAERLARFAQ